MARPPEKPAGGPDAAQAARAALETAVAAAEKVLGRLDSGEDWLTVIEAAREVTRAAGDYLHVTRPWDGPPLTVREADVLTALCVSAGDGDLFRRPPTVGAIASALGVTEAAVKQHLMQLYRKFGVV